MSNLAKNYQQQTVDRVEPAIQPQRKPRVEKRLFTLGEKLLFVGLIAFASFMAIKIIATQASIYEVNKDIQKLEQSIQTQQKQNNNLDVQISEQKTYDRILEKAKQAGLDLNEENIKVVE
ncbi:cell division protein FtsL [Bacillus spongiae]|uniref:Cell division protein FtsL n=1 Tax=Bacillus spongiae TaxID=2683610 RepID=A0ABU8HA78_9BACI